MRGPEVKRAIAAHARLLVVRHGPPLHLVADDPVSEALASAAWAGLAAELDARASGTWRRNPRAAANLPAKGGADGGA